MTVDFEWYAGIDWASEQHRVCLLDGGSRRAGEREFAHSGDGLAELCAWLIAMSGCEPQKIAVAIETPHGPVVEMLIDQGFAVHSINPKQLDRFRDRFTVAGAKDDSRDAQVLGHSLKTDGHAFRRLVVDDPMIVELREWSRLGDDLKQERNRLANRLRQQLWRYYPQMLELGGDDIAADWLLALWDEAPTPAKAAEISTQVIAPLLKAHRIRRFEAADVLRILRQTPLTVAPGTIAAASAHIRILAERLRLVNRQVKETNRKLDRLCRKLGQATRAARRGDPALLAGGRKDQPRRAAHRGQRASQAQRLSRPQADVRGCSGDPAQRQGVFGDQALGLQCPAGESRLSLGAGCQSV
jgi:hypothetical protein